MDKYVGVNCGKVVSVANQVQLVASQGRGELCRCLTPASAKGGELSQLMHIFYRCPKLCSTVSLNF